MPTPQQRSRSEEFPRWQVFSREVALVNGIELLEERQVRACNLYVHQVVHGHPGLRQDRLLPVQQVLYLVFNLLRRFPRPRIQPDPASEIESIPRQNRVAEGQLRGLILEIDCFSRGLYRDLSKSSDYGKYSSRH